MEPVTGPIYALDLAVATGFAVGRPGSIEVPRSGTVRLKKPHEPRSIAFSNLIAFLAEEWTAERPALVVKERMLALQAFQAFQRDPDNPKAMRGGEGVIRLHAGLHAIVEGMCARFDIPFDVDAHDVADSTARKHFLGKGKLGTREETKAAVVGRCHLLGLMPRDCTDDNRADALCVHDWACATFGRRSASTSRLHLFGETL